MPGRKDAGVIWAKRYDEFLINKCGMRQSVVDRRLFALVDSDGTLLAHVHVDDTRLTFTSLKKREWFLRLWDAEFGDDAASKSKLVDRPFDKDFVGIKRHVVDANTVEYSCLGVIKNLHDLIKAHGLPPGSSAQWPMSADATRELRDSEPSAKYPHIPEKVELARKICGTIGFVATHTRPDAYFGFCFLARFQGPRLTERVFTHLLRLAWYLVGTKELPLVIHNDRVIPGKAWGRSGLITAWVDSSHGNADGGRSYGGFVIMNNGGGALAWKCIPHPIATDSPGAQELMMGTACLKYIMGMRMLLLDLGVPADEMGPTTMMTDSQIMLDGTACEKLVKLSRWLAARYAMIRNGIASKLIDPTKVEGKMNVADILTKPLCGLDFNAHRRTILGLDHRT